MESSTVPDLDPRSRRRLESFSVDPTDVASFRLLEEELFLAGAWSLLAGVYECRLSALEAGRPEWKELLFRLGELLEQRVADPAAAIQRYEELLRVAPQDARTLGQLRRLHASQGSLTAALQIAEVEESLPLEPPERARMLAEVGQLWVRVGERADGEERLREAMRLDPTCEAALGGMAELAEARGDRSRAVALHLQRLESQRGSSRADTLERLAELSSRQEARRHLREVLRLDPERRSALERLLELEVESGAWGRVHALRSELFDQERDPSERRSLALAAAREQVGHAGELEHAREWVARLEELGDTDAEIQQVRADVYSKTGDREQQIDALEQLVSMRGPAAEPVRELARLHMQASRAERALDWLQVQLERDPSDTKSLELVDRCLSSLERHAERAELIEIRARREESSRGRAELYVELGDLHVGALDDAAAAEHAYRNALAQDPTYGVGGERLTELLRKLGRGEELVATLLGRARDLEGRPESVELWCEVGELQIEEPIRAQEAFCSALARNPRHPRAIRGLHAIAERTGDPILQLEACERELALELPPERHEELLGIAVRSAEAAGDLARARHAAEAWVELSPGASSLETLARIARELGDAAREQRALEALLEQDDPSASARAGILNRLGDLAARSDASDAQSRACDWYREAQALEPNAERAEKLAELCRTVGDAAGLAEQLELALERETGERESSIALELASTRTALGDFDGAIDVLRDRVHANLNWREGVDALESLLASQERHEQRLELLQELLATTLPSSERATRAQEIATLLLDTFGRADEASELLEGLVDPRRGGAMEALFERALEAGGDVERLADWLERREPFAAPAEQFELLSRRAALVRELGSLEGAIDCLRRAERQAPEPERPALRANLFEWIREIDQPDRQAEILGLLLEQTGTGSERAALRVERARLRAANGEAEAALQELARAREESPLDVAGLRLLVAIAAECNAADRQVQALEELAQQSDDTDERVRSLLVAASLRVQGPETLRDPAAAEAALRRVLDERPAHREAFERLGRILEEAGRNDALADLLEARLSVEDLAEKEVAPLALRIARVSVDRGRSIRALLTAVDRNVGSEALVEELYGLLVEAGDGERCARLCENQTRHAPGRARGFWGRRWLRALERLNLDAARELRAVEAMLEEAPEVGALVERQVRLLRDFDRPRDLASALERALEMSAGTSSPHRALHLRELLALLEGPLDEPARALDWIEKTEDASPQLLARGARIAESLEDRDREIALLKRLMAAGEDGLAAVHGLHRRLGLALWRGDEPAEAEPLLRRSLAIRPRDVEVVEALEAVERGKDDPAGLGQILELKFAVQSEAARVETAREGFTQAERAADARSALRWLRREHALRALPLGLCRRRVELERKLGDPSSLLDALLAQAEAEDAPAARASALASAAYLYEERGDLELARQTLAEARQSTSDPAAPWLEAEDRILSRLGRVAERSDVLEELAAHPDLGPEDRERHGEARLRLLRARPELHADAVAALERRVSEAAEARLDDLRELLRLYDALARASDWCETARAICARVEGRERDNLRAELAHRLGDEIGDREGAIEVWELLLAERPDDVEILDRLAVLRDVPGEEARRADVLERRARHVGSEPRDAQRAAERLVAAAKLRFEALGDPNGALENLEHALALDPDSPDVHEIRARVCARLDERDAEQESLRALLGLGGAARPATARVEGRAELWLRLARILSERPETRADAERALASSLEGAVDAGHFAEVRDVLEHLGAWRSAIELLREEIDASDTDSCHGLLREAGRLAWEGLGDADITCDALEALEEAGGLSARDRLRLSDALESRGDVARALEQRLSALEGLGEGASVEAWLELARLALDSGSDASLARSACDNALARDPDAREALSLRAEVHRRSGDARAEIADRIELGDHARTGAEAAEALVDAARVAREVLADGERARELYREALEREPSALEALVGAGRLALEHEEWQEAERLLSLASEQLADGPEPGRCAGIARLAARAAIQGERFDRAFQHLERALASEPDEIEALELAAPLALQLGAHRKAYDLIGARLRLGGLAPTDEADWLRRRSQASEGLGDDEAAIEALERAIELEPDDEIARARAVDLLERNGQLERAIERLDAWSRTAEAEYRAELALRAGRLERACELPRDALDRFERLVETEPAHREAWCEIAELRLELDGAEAADRAVAEARERFEATGPVQARLAWVEARACEALGDAVGAASLAAATLDVRPDHLEAARLLARRLGQSGDFAAAVASLERALDCGEVPAHVEAELAEAIGRSYAGPLEDIERAQRAFRRALDRNPDRSSARESLADITSFDPGSHPESVKLHRELLDRYPGRVRSWLALARIGGQWKHDRVISTCREVLDLLGAEAHEAPDIDGPLAVRVGTTEDSVFETANELLCALHQADALPRFEVDPALEELPAPLRRELVELAGRAALADDAGLQSLFVSALDPDEVDLTRRTRRRLRRSLRGERAAEVAALPAREWRGHALARAAASAVECGDLTLAIATRALLRAWHDTADLQFADSTERGAIIQLCAPARDLLLRVADGCVDALGL